MEAVRENEGAGAWFASGRACVRGVVVVEDAVRGKKGEPRAEKSVLRPEVRRSIFRFQARVFL